LASANIKASLLCVSNVPPPLPAALVCRTNPNCFIVRDANGQALSYVYYENEPGRRSAAKLPTKDACFGSAYGAGNNFEVLPANL